MQKLAALPRTLRVRSRCGVRFENSQTRALLRDPEGSLLRNPGRLILSPLRLSPDVAPPWTFVWPPLLLRQLAETQRRRHLIANSRATYMKSWNCDNRAFNIALLSGQRMGDSRNSNASVRNRHCLQSERSADVVEITSAQMETRDPNRSSTAESSHGTSSPAKSTGTGRMALRWYH